jgi:hypothetical protein
MPAVGGLVLSAVLLLRASERDNQEVVCSDWG